MEQASHACLKSTAEALLVLLKAGIASPLLFTPTVPTIGVRSTLVPREDDWLVHFTLVERFNIYKYRRALQFTKQSWQAGLNEDGSRMDMESWNIKEHTTSVTNLFF
jgi:hypothetical protein